MLWRLVILTKSYAQEKLKNFNILIGTSAMKLLTHQLKTIKYFYSCHIPTISLSTKPHHWMTGTPCQRFRKKSSK